MGASGTSPDLLFQAAVERMLTVVWRDPEGRWEGHDYRVEVVAARRGLNAFDVVMDFRVLEQALDRALEPLQGRLLSDLGLADPLALLQRLAADLAPVVPPPAWLAEVALTDGRGRRRALQP